MQSCETHGFPPTQGNHAALNTLLDNKNFNMVYAIPDCSEPASFSCHIAPATKCRAEKEAYELIRPHGMGIKEALWTATKDTEHHTEHWVQLVTMAKTLLLPIIQGRLLRWKQ